MTLKLLILLDLGWSSNTAESPTNRFDRYSSDVLLLARSGADYPPSSLLSRRCALSPLSRDALAFFLVLLALPVISYSRHADLQHFLPS